MPAFIKDINQPKEILEKLLDYASHSHGFLLLSGSNGTGKSFAAEAIYHANADYILPFRGEDQAIFTTQADLNITHNAHLKNDGTAYLLKIHCDTRFLVLDDLGTRTPSEAFMDFLYALIDYRYRERFTKGTIITTNLNSASMREKFGDSVLSRIASGTVIRMDGADRRFKDF